MGAVPAQRPTGERARADRAVHSEAATARVAVLMPAYNPGPLINKALRSIVANTQKCDIYVVDDGSRVPVSEILDDFPRTAVIRLEQNGGVARALNAGLSVILQKPYDYVARLDADDTSYPERLAKQVAFLDENPDVAVVGTWARFVDQDSGDLVFTGRTPESPERVRRAMNYNTAVIHTSAMIRTRALKAVGSYSDQYPVAEDYELFRRISQR
jgi:glycosyltransferase involved in cell wall biosynthesis